MFIKKEKYEEMVNKIKVLEEDNKEKDKELFLLSGRKNDIEGINNLNVGRIKQLEKDLTTYMTNQSTLIDWIEKILQEAGTCTVHSRQPFTIPVYKSYSGSSANYAPAADKTVDAVRNLGVALKDAGDVFNNGFVSREEIIIPEIRIIKMSR